MARPTKLNADYFPHYNDMRNDRKMKALRGRFGAAGYGVYVMLLETLAGADLLTVDWLQIDIDMIANDLGVETDFLLAIVLYLVEIKVLNRCDNKLTCPELDSLSETLFSKRKSDLRRLRAETGVSDAETIVSDAETGVSVDKEKKRKEKKSIEEKSKEKTESARAEKDAAPPPFQVVDDHFSKSGSSRFAAVSFYNHWTRHKWKNKRGEPIKIWRNAANGWIRKNNGEVEGAQFSPVEGGVNLDGEKILAVRANGSYETAAGEYRYNATKDDWQKVEPEEPSPRAAKVISMAEALKNAKVS